MARVRFRIVVPAVLIGLLMFFGIYVAYLVFRSPAQGFADDFDANLASTAPEVLQVAQSDPALHRLLLEKSQAAFLRGGWPAAREVFRMVVDARINAFASDKATLGCWEAWHGLFKALQQTPHLCRQVIEQGDWGLPHGVADAAMSQRARACGEMTLDGGRQRMAVDRPGHMDVAAFNETYARALDGPNSLSEAERSALSDPSGVSPGDDATLCSAQLAFDDNVATWPIKQAASYERTRYAVREGDFLYLPHPITPLQKGPPPDLHCAPLGTRFILSNEDSRTGLPITWESRGQAHWDCAIKTSLSGQQNMFAEDGDPAAENTLHLLWPLQIGKTAYCHCVFDKTTDFRVSAYARFWLPWGYFDAFSIKETETGADGRPDYTITRYWAPSLGMLIGRKTNVYRGGWPQDADPDWQLVAMQAPVPPQPPNMSLSSPSPLPKVIRPGYGGEN